MSDTPPSSSVRLSVVVPAHQAAAVLWQQLDALTRQGGGDWWEVVVVDNGSTDGTGDLARRYGAIHPRIRVLEAHAAANASYARNAGAQAARGRSVAFVDADDVVGDGWVAAMDAALQRHELVAGPLEYSRLNPGWAVAVRGTAQGEAFFHVDGGPAWPVVFAANLGVSKRLHEQVGGFDETLPWGGEDADYGWRLQQLGASPVWVEGAVVHYRVRDRLRPMYRQAVGYARSRWDLHSRYAEVWPVAPTAPTCRQLVTRSVLRLRRVRSRTGLGQWLWDVGWSVGNREGARRHPSAGSAG